LAITDSIVIEWGTLVREKGIKDPELYAKIQKLNGGEL
jgi:hypothetical protein